MIKQKDIKVTTYTKLYADGNKDYLFIVEVIDFGDSFEAWIRLYDYGVAELMFGSPKKQENGHDVDYDGFVEMVEANFDEYAELYVDNHGE